MKRSKITGIIGTVTIHAIVLVLLFILTISKPEMDEEGGVPVMLGNTALAQGNASPYAMTEVDIMPESENGSIPEPPANDTEPKQPLITQPDESAIKVKENSITEPERKPVTVREEKVETPDEKTKEQIEAEKRAAAERAAAEAAANKVAGAFGKGTQMGSKGTATSEKGIQGNKEGNSDSGKVTGIGGYGQYDLGGRKIGKEGLPLPVYNVQDEGRVVVTIWVNPAGQVVRTAINKRTNTTVAALREAAEEAARKARFLPIEGVDDQIGTITYFFKLK